jgi:hypothetical protein
MVRRGLRSRKTIVFVWNEVYNPVFLVIKEELPNCEGDQSWNISSRNCSRNLNRGK